MNGTTVIVGILVLIFVGLLINDAPVIANMTADIAKITELSLAAFNGGTTAEG